MGTVGEQWALRAVSAAGGLGSPAVSGPGDTRGRDATVPVLPETEGAPRGGHCRTPGPCVWPRPPSSLEDRPEWGSGARVAPPGDGRDERGRRRQDPSVAGVPRLRPHFCSTARGRGGRSRVYTRVSPRESAGACVQVCAPARWPSPGPGSKLARGAGQQEEGRGWMVRREKEREMKAAGCGIK